MDTRYDRILNQTKGFRLNFSEKDRLDVNDGEEGEFRINKSNGVNNLYIKINKKWKSIQLFDPQTNIQGNVEQSDSYENLGMPPCNYDSGWVAASNDNNYDFIHNLGTQILSLQIYIRDGSYRIFKAQSYQDYGGDYEGGISVYIESDDKINIGTANDAILTHDNTSIGSTVTKVTSGHIRVLAWKIQGI